MESTLMSSIIVFLVITSKMSAKGDSGALVLYDENNVLPQHKPYKHFQFGSNKISIRQNWAHDGVAGIVWDAAVVMCEYIVSNTEFFKGKNVLELGAGTGLAGLCAYLQGASVLLTDREESIGILKENVMRNTAVRSNKEASHSSFAYCSVDQTCDSTFLGKDNSIEVAVLNWSDRKNTYFNSEWDVVIGSDIIYIESSFDDLLTTMRQLKSSSILLSCRLRYDKDYKFIELSKEYFNVKLVVYDENRDIRIFSFRFLD
ncbi:protein N-lysine methyltransferase METTL21A-like [Watersipora subatra]|uniref:protein N-lysine methyltransferase METTL21A-like n=1 Tax=Watersipora subatra TaxID=2589382 RepID=UPI00355C23F7